MIELTELVDHAEYYRDEKCMTALQEYVEKRPELFNETSALSREIEETILQYLSSGNDLKRSQIKIDVTALRRELEGNDIIDRLLAQEVITSYLMYQFSLTKLVRHYGYNGVTETRKVSSLQTNFLRSLRDYKKIKGNIPDINFNQINHHIYQ
jgi:hypothetical protein